VDQVVPDRLALPPADGHGQRCVALLADRSYKTIRSDGSLARANPTYQRRGSCTVRHRPCGSRSTLAPKALPEPSITRSPNSTRPPPGRNQHTRAIQRLDTQCDHFVVAAGCRRRTGSLSRLRFRPRAVGCSASSAAQSTSPMSCATVRKQIQQST
jgi:hypothetical protein